VSRFDIFIQFDDKFVDEYACLRSISVKFRRLFSFFDDKSLSDCNFTECLSFLLKELVIIRGKCSCAGSLYNESDWRELP